MRAAPPTIRLLGPPQIGSPSSAVPLERKSAGVFSYLAIHGESARNTLAALFWPDAEPDGARNNLRQTLFKLRKAAHEDLIVGTTHLRLASGVAVDAIASPPPDGQLLEGCEYADCPDFAQWLDAERNRLDRMRLEIAAAEAAALESAGRFDEALRIAEDLVRRMPLEELGHRRVIRLHYLRGDRAAALAAYERCVERLRNELDIAPSEETRSLAASLEAGLLPVPRSTRAAVPVTLSRPPRLIGREKSSRRSIAHGRTSAPSSSWASPVSASRGCSPSSARTVRGSSSWPRVPAIQRFPMPRSRGSCASPSSTCRPLPTARGATSSRACSPNSGSAPGRSLEGQRLSLQRALVAMLQAAIGNGVAAVVLDDLHFADEASVEMLHSLVGADGLGPLSWGFAQRPAEGGQAARSLREALGEAARSSRFR